MASSEVWKMDIYFCTKNLVTRKIFEPLIVTASILILIFDLGN